jgi:hypothetical protein
VVARLTASGGQSIAYFKAVALALGYDITITQYSPSHFGRPFGLPFGGTAWAFAWQVNAPMFTINRLEFGGSFGTPFASWGNNVLQCELLRIAPAHATFFSHTPDIDVDRLIAPNTVTAEQADTAPATGTPAYATDGNPATQQLATQWPAYQYNAIQGN